MNISISVPEICGTLRRTWDYLTPSPKRWLLAFAFGLPFIVGVLAWVTTKTRIGPPTVWAYDHWMFEAVGYGATMLLAMFSAIVLSVALIVIGAGARKTGKKLSRVGADVICGGGFMIFGSMLALATVDVIFNRWNPGEWSLVFGDAMICFSTVYLARTPQEFTSRKWYDRVGAVLTGLVMLGGLLVMVGHIISGQDILHI